MQNVSKLEHDQSKFLMLCTQGLFLQNKINLYAGKFEIRTTACNWAAFQQSNTLNFTDNCS